MAEDTYATHDTVSTYYCLAEAERFELSNVNTKMLMPLPTRLHLHEKAGIRPSHRRYILRMH